MSYHFNSGEFLSDLTITIPANKSGSFIAGSNTFFSGTSGLVQYQADYNTDLWIGFNFSNLYVRSNLYGYSHYSWVDITTSGGDGCEAYVTYHVVSYFFIH